MAKKVIHIYGPSGSGTTTLGKYICSQCHYFLMDADDYFWKATNPPYTMKQDRIKRIQLMKDDIEKHENVVISGSIADWGDALIPDITLAIRLETTTAIRLKRLKQREKQEFGSRIDVGGDMYENHMNFLEWAKAYDEGGLEMRSKAKHDAWEKMLSCPIIYLDGSQSVESHFEKIKSLIGE